MENDYNYLTTPEFPEADQIIAKHLQRLALLKIQECMEKDTRAEGWDYFNYSEEDLDNLERYAG